MSTELEHRILEKLLQQKKIVIDFMISNKNCCWFSWNLSISLNGRGSGIISWNLSVRWKDLRNLVVEGSEVQVLTKVVALTSGNMFWGAKLIGVVKNIYVPLIFIILFLVQTMVIQTNLYMNHQTCFFLTKPIGVKWDARLFMLMLSQLKVCVSVCFPSDSFHRVSQI